MDVSFLWFREFHLLIDKSVEVTYCLLRVAFINLLDAFAIFSAFYFVGEIDKEQDAKTDAVSC
jgi:hypothetical protein